MRLLTLLQQTFGFTRNELKVIFLLAGTFLAGVAIHWYRGEARMRTLSAHHFDYSVADSIFRARSKKIDSVRSTDSRRDPQSHRSIRGGSTTSNGAVDLNTASKTELMQLPGIGPAYAERMLQYRKDHGRFGSIDELKKIKGIGKKKFERLRSLVKAG